MESLATNRLIEPIVDADWSMIGAILGHEGLGQLRRSLENQGAHGVGKFLVGPASGHLRASESLLLPESSLLLGVLKKLLSRAPLSRTLFRVIRTLRDGETLAH